MSLDFYPNNEKIPSYFINSYFGIREFTSKLD